MLCVEGVAFGGVVGSVGRDGIACGLALLCQWGWWCLGRSCVWLGGTWLPGGVVEIVVCGGGWEGRRVTFELACSTDDQRRATKQEQANLWAASVLAHVYLPSVTM